MCLYQETVVLAILPDRLHLEIVARGGALLPHLLPAATVEPDILTGECLIQGFLVHVAQH